MATWCLQVWLRKNKIGVGPAQNKVIKAQLGWSRIDPTTVDPIKQIGQHLFIKSFSYKATNWTQIDYINIYKYIYEKK